MWRGPDARVVAAQEPVSRMGIHILRRFYQPGRSVGRRQNFRLSLFAKVTPTHLTGQISNRRRAVNES